MPKLRNDATVAVQNPAPQAEPCGPIPKSRTFAPKLAYVMKKILLLLVVAGLAFAGYWFFLRKKQPDGPTAPKQEALKVGKHSALFNDSVAKVLNAYFDMKTALVSADTAAAKTACRNMLALANALQLTELKKDTAGIFDAAFAQLGDIKGSAESLLNQSDVQEMRMDFKSVSDNVYPFLKTIKYEGPKLYWQSCPMAFGDNKPAEWLSNSEEVVNPYLGNNHPEYKAGMLHCGEVKDTIQ
jgi:hypothetical protein